MILAGDGQNTWDSKFAWLETEAALARFVRDFEDGTLPRAEWTHAAHLAVASWYLLEFPKDEAVQRVRNGIPRYNERAGIRNTPDSGYHETLTRFWLEIVSAFLIRRDAPAGRLEQVRRVVAEFAGRRDLHRKFYSFDVVQSRQARREWVTPDLDCQLFREQE
jgi:hypothetical protein